MLKKILFELIIIVLFAINMLTFAHEVKHIKSESKMIVVPNDYPTIQGAINAANPGDTVFVKAGTYYENVIVNKTVLLIGESRENTIIDARGVGKALELTVDGTLISNFTISYGEVGIHITNSHGHTIRNNIIKKNVRGITGNYYTNTIHEYNVVKENEYGIDFGHLGGPSSTNNIARYNEIFDNFAGIYISSAEGQNIVDSNLISNNNIGIVLDNTKDNTITNNIFLNNTRAGGFEKGIYIRNAVQNNIKHNTFAYNSVGVFMDKGGNNRILNNNFLFNSYGIYLTFNESVTYIGFSFNNKIIGNSFLNNTYGIYSNIGAATFINSQFNTTILKNELNNNTYAIYLHLSPVNLILQNMLSGNNYGIYIELSSGNSLVNNAVTRSEAIGMIFHLSSDNCLTSNNVTNCNVGIRVSLSNRNLIRRNLFATNIIGMDISLSNDNIIYNNDFVGNNKHVATDGLSSNKWDSSYPEGGNFWSDYNGTDQYSGPHQNETGIDGIGDTPYIVDVNKLFGTSNIDYYPLMKPCIMQSYTLTIISGMGGTTSPPPGIYNHIAGTELNVTAIPNVGFSFDYWLLDGQKRTENPMAILMDTNHTLEAYFIDDIPPITTDDYDGFWHNADFIITLTATDYGSGVAETYYRINSGPVKAVSVDGQPTITTEGANNALEYWSVDNAGNEEIPHKFLTGIKLDKTAPVVTDISRQPEDYVEPGQAVKVLVDATDSLSGVKDVILSYIIGDSTTWIDVPMTFNARSGLYESVIQGQQANTLVKYKITVYDNAGNSIVEDNNGQYYAYMVIPEFPSTMILLLFVLITLITIVLQKKKRRPK